VTRTYRLISLGCAKNLVDSEGIAALLRRAGWEVAPTGPVDLILVNTCAFIEEATTESVDTLLEMAEAKQAGETRWLAAVGCLPEKYREELAREMPELDLVIGVPDFQRLDVLLENLTRTGERQISFAPHPPQYAGALARLLSTPPHRAFLKVADGCSNACAYCIIGRLRGPFRSRPLADIFSEARELVAGGVVELDMVAQDLTLYGSDLKPHSSLPELLRRLDEIDGLRWLRLLYAHPARVDEALAATMAQCRAVVPYLDLPLQHVSDRVLQRMSRPQTRAQSERALSWLRTAMPDIALRTTFLVGHPGETEDDVAELIEFIRAWRFDHLGAFAWSPEEGTASYAQDEWVDRDEARDRLDRVLAAQQEISREKLAERIGGEEEILIEEVLHKHDDDAYSHVGRSARQAPDVDGVTYLRAPAEDSCRVGRIVRGRVTEAADYDLFADLIE